MKTGRSRVGTLMALSLGIAFALCSLYAALFGANVYTRVLDDAYANDVARTATLYIANKVRQSDMANGVSLGYVQGQAALVLKSTVDEETVLTYLYLYAGELKEVSVLEGTTVSVESGQYILPLAAFVVSLESNDMLRICVSDNKGHEAQILLSLRATGKPS